MYFYFGIILMYQISWVLRPEEWGIFLVSGHFSSLNIRSPYAAYPALEILWYELF